MSERPFCWHGDDDALELRLHNLDTNEPPERGHLRDGQIVPASSLQRSLLSQRNSWRCSIARNATSVQDLQGTEALPPIPSPELFSGLARVGSGMARVVVREASRQAAADMPQWLVRQMHLHSLVAISRGGEGLVWCALVEVMQLCGHAWLGLVPAGRPSLLFTAMK